MALYFDPLVAIKIDPGWGIQGRKAVPRTFHMEQLELLQYDLIITAVDYAQVHAKLGLHRFTRTLFCRKVGVVARFRQLRGGNAEQAGRVG